MRTPVFRVLTVAVAAAVAGCNSYKVVQTSYFVDDDGAIVRVDYGRAKRDHVNAFKSPANGRELEFKSKLVVDVRMPDGDSFTAWQCMNFSGNGTMYKPDDDEWYFLASGFTCKIAQQDEDRPMAYKEVFKGVLCNTPVEIPKKDSRWRKVKPQAGKAAVQ